MLVMKKGDSGVKNGGTGPGEMEKESYMMELTRLVQKVVKESSWWERRGLDCSILAAAFLCLPPGKAQLHATDIKVPGCWYIDTKYISLKLYINFKSL